VQPGRAVFTYVFIGTRLDRVLSAYFSVGGVENEVRLITFLGYYRGLRGETKFQELQASVTYSKD
jgi:hypothetical protein